MANSVFQNKLGAVLRWHSSHACVGCSWPRHLFSKACSPSPGGLQGVEAWTQGTFRMRGWVSISAVVVTGEVLKGPIRPIVSSPPSCPGNDFQQGVQSQLREVQVGGTLESHQVVHSVRWGQSDVWKPSDLPLPASPPFQMIFLCRQGKQPMGSWANEREGTGHTCHPPSLLAPC